MAQSSRDASRYLFQEQGLNPVSFNNTAFCCDATMIQDSWPIFHCIYAETAERCTIRPHQSYNPGALFCDPQDGLQDLIYSTDETYSGTDVEGYPYYTFKADNHYRLNALPHTYGSTMRTYQWTKVVRRRSVAVPANRGITKTASRQTSRQGRSTNRRQTLNYLQALRLHETPKSQERPYPQQVDAARVIDISDEPDIAKLPGLSSPASSTGSRRRKIATRHSSSTASEESTTINIAGATSTCNEGNVPDTDETASVTISRASTPKDIENQSMLYGNGSHMSPRSVKPGRDNTELESLLSSKSVIGSAPGAPDMEHHSAAIPDTTLGNDAGMWDVGATTAEDTYWEWDLKSQKFRHWDEEQGEFVFCPDQFD